MADALSKARRSAVMASVRGSGNKSTELALANIFRQRGITGWRRNQKIFGKPDFVFLKLKLVVFVDGCFWHGCPKHATQPKNNRAFWRRKFSRNKKRDMLVTCELRGQGWRVLRVWEHELCKANEARLVRRLTTAIGG